MVAPNEPEFQQAYTELVSSLEDSTLFQKRPELKRILKVVSIPERTVQFRVAWENDQGEVEVNNGFRVQFNSALGPYKGGLRFHPTVTLSVLKFLGFEQVRFFFLRFPVPRPSRPVSLSLFLADTVNNSYRSSKTRLQASTWAVAKAVRTLTPRAAPPRKFAVSAKPS